MLSIQNEREWASFCQTFMGNAGLCSDPRFCNNNLRTRNREALEADIQAVFGQLDYAQATARLSKAQTAYGAINSVQDLIEHPQLRTRPMDVHGVAVEVPATPYATEWDDECFKPVPAIGQHGELPVPD